jgi:hypothetical protein
LYITIIISSESPARKGIANGLGIKPMSTQKPVSIADLAQLELAAAGGGAVAHAFPLSAYSSMPR